MENIEQVYEISDGGDVQDNDIEVKDEAEVKIEDDGTHGNTIIRHDEVIEIKSENQGEDDVPQGKAIISYDETIAVKSEVKTEDCGDYKSLIEVNREYQDTTNLKHLKEKGFFEDFKDEIFAMEDTNHSGGQGGRYGRDKDDNYDDEDDEALKRVWRNKILEAFEKEEEKDMIFTIGFELSKTKCSIEDLMNQTLYFPITFYTHELVKFIECYIMKPSQAAKTLKCKLNLLPSDDGTRQKIIKLLVQCVKGIRSGGFNWTMRTQQELGQGKWTRISWSKSLQLKFEMSQPLTLMEEPPTKKPVKQEAKKPVVLEDMQEQIIDEIDRQKGNWSDRTLVISVEQPFSSNVAKEAKKAFTKMDLDENILCSFLPSQGAIWARIDLFPVKKSEERIKVVDLLAQVFSYAEIRETKEISKLQNYKGKAQWRYL